MMEQWGVPNILLHAKVHEYASLLAAHGGRVPDISLGGGLAKPSPDIQSPGPVLALRQTGVHGPGHDDTGLCGGQY